MLLALSAGRVTCFLFRAHSKYLLIILKVTNNYSSKPNYEMTNFGTEQSFLYLNLGFYYI